MVGRKNCLFMVPGINETFTHVVVNIEYMDIGRVFCYLCSSTEHLIGTCPYKPGFELEYYNMYCSADPILYISEEKNHSEIFMWFSKMKNCHQGCFREEEFG